MKLKLEEHIKNCHSDIVTCTFNNQINIELPYLNPPQEMQQLMNKIYSKALQVDNIQ